MIELIGNLGTRLREVSMRMAAAGLISPRFFLPSVPDESELPGREGPLEVEIVSHCWRYHAFLAYQLTSLVDHPPSFTRVRMTVVYSSEDVETLRMLEFFGAIEVDHVEWNWIDLPKEQLFRRAIGRNLAARRTEADWIWFTDCDVLFLEGCLDALGRALQGRRDRLVFPSVEHVTPLLPDDDPVLGEAAERPQLVRIDPSRFYPQTLDVAKGPMQITHGDVARAVGYCEQLAIYQEPSDRWRKAWEDRAFRWLLRTEGAPLDVPGVYRIRHASKGRYSEYGRIGRIRGWSRRVQSGLKERLLGRAGERVVMKPLQFLRKLDSKRRARKKRPELTAFREAVDRLGPDDVAIDCGANVGLFTIEMARSGATVYAFEPNPAAFAALEERVRDYPNVKAIQAAVTAAAGPVTLYLHKWAADDPLHWSTSSSLIAEKRNVRREGAVVVDGISLAQFIRDLGRRIAILKIDVEGAEVAILNHLLDEGLHDQIDQAFVEVHDKRIPALAEPTRALTERLRALGATQFRLDWK